VSFTDAVTNGTIEQKQAIVALIARRFSPAFAPALRKALEDPVPAVRVQAAAAAAAIEQRFSARAMKLEQAAAKRAGQAGHFRELGALYAEMADSGILEKARADAARAKALEHFRTVLTLIPDDPEALSASAKLLLDQGKPKEATQRLSLALAKTQDDAALAALLVEALMREGRFADIRNLARAARGRFTGAQAEVARLEEALAFWAAGARA
jgi:tetratricopeptide (TPR) repeat protein